MIHSVKYISCGMLLIISARSSFEIRNVFRARGGEHILKKFSNKKKSYGSIIVYSDDTFMNDATDKAVAAD